MLRLRNSQLTVWNFALPGEILELKEELAKVDALLDDEKFMTPFIEKFNTKTGRPTVPVETYLRLMYLKFRYELGYEVLVDYNLNETLVVKAREQKVIRGRKLRVDTTAVEADIHYPTDASILSDGIRIITRTVKKIKELGAAVRTNFRDRQRSVKNRILSITKVVKRRTGESYTEVRKITGEIMGTAKQVVIEAQKVVTNTKQYLNRNKNNLSQTVNSLVQNLKESIRITGQIIDQTTAVQGGNFHLPDRIISVFDTAARPIRRGKIHAPTEFGYKVMLQETEEKVITGYEVLDGNPNDDTLLVDAIDKHIKTFGRPPRAVAGDRGFGSAENERILKEKGVKQCSLPRKGKISKARKEYQSQSGFKRLQRWRAGGEATISVLKRKYGLRRSRLRHANGTKTWVGFGILTYNLRKIASLT